MIINFFIDLLVTILFWLVIASIGRYPTLKFSGENLGTIEELLFSLGWGTVITCFAIMVLGVLGLYYRSFVIALSVGLVLVFGRQVIDLARRLWQYTAAYSRNPGRKNIFC